MNDYGSKSSSKTESILLALTTRSLNRFEAERLGDHCLNSTISTLTNFHGLNFERVKEKVPNRFGGQTTVVRYRLFNGESAKASQLLVRMQNRRQKPVL
jgi:hypothetical protein